MTRSTHRPTHPAPHRATVATAGVPTTAACESASDLLTSVVGWLINTDRQFRATQSHIAEFGSRF